MIETLSIFILIAMSISCLWNESEIFIPLRILVTKIPIIRGPLLCPECSTFWIGFALSFMWNPVLSFDIGYFSYDIISNIVLASLSYLAAHIFYNSSLT